MANQTTEGPSLEQELSDLQLDSKNSKKESLAGSKSGSGNGADEHPGASSNGQQANPNDLTRAKRPPGETATYPDPALLSALLDNNKERALVLRMEQDVVGFLGDTARDIFEFPVDYSNYQRMLAHKVAQYHGLQTSTSDYEGNQCRVVAHRTGPGDKNKPLLSSLDMSQGSVLAAAAAKSAAQWQETPKILRRPGTNRHHERPFDTALPNSIPRTPKDRDDDYDRARARIVGDADGSSVSGSIPGSAVSGSRGTPGRGIVAGRGRRGGRGERGGELHDTEYMRSMQRYGMVGMYDGSQPVSPVFMTPHGMPMMYVAQQPEVWGGMYAMQGRQPPPPPPGSSSSFTSKAANSTAPGSTAVWVNSQTPPTAGMAAAAPAGSAAPSAGVVPPPPPPPPGARPYQPAGAMTPVAMYPTAAGGMQAMPPGAMQPGYMYVYPGAYPGAVLPGTYPGGMPTAYPPGSVPAAYPGHMHPGYPGAMQAMTPQGYGTMYTTAAPGATAVPGTTAAMPHAMAARPAGAAPTSMSMTTYAPVHALPPGYAHAVPYPMMQHAGPGMAAAPIQYSMVQGPHMAGYSSNRSSTAGASRGGRGGRGEYRQGSHTHAGSQQQPPPPPQPANGSTAAVAAMQATRSASNATQGSTATGGEQKD